MSLDGQAHDELVQAVSELGISLSAGQLQQLLGHLNLLAKWNKTYNLTAVRAPADMLRQHLIDSLSAVAPLQTHLKNHTGLARSQLVLDVGSGAGFPGVTMAIALPELQVVCVDSVGKKVGFIRQVVAELGLPNLRAEHARVEDLPPLGCDVITSRAFASLPDFTRLTRSHLAQEGVWMAMKGRAPVDELAGLPEDIEVFHVEQLNVPKLEAERCLIWIRPKLPQR